MNQIEINQEFKKNLLAECSKNIQQKIDVCQKAILDAQGSSNEDTKSSAGDKYETSREMAQQVINMNSKQKAILEDELFILKKINFEQSLPIVGLGSLIKTQNQIFFIGVGIGLLKINQNSIIVISQQSPIAQQFKGKSASDIVIFNNITHQIVEVY